MQKRAEAAEEKALSCARASLKAPPPTRDELVGIISRAIRDTKATGSDIKGLSATLQTLVPDLFQGKDSKERPDPVALIKYIASFDGMQGAEVVKELGGAEFLANQLSEILKTPVSLG